MGTARKRPSTVRVGSRTTASGTETLDVVRDLDRITVRVWRKAGTGWTQHQKVEVFSDEVAWLRHALLEAAAGVDPAEAPEDLADVAVPEGPPS